MGNSGDIRNMKYPCLLVKKISEISPSKYNPRTISDESLGRLTKSLAEFGNIQPITWNARTGNIVGGHQRLKVYQAMGKKEVEVWAVDLSEQKEKAANIALNKLSGEFDMTSLKDLIEEINTGDIDLDITGFSSNEIEQIMVAFQGQVDVDEEWKEMPEFEQKDQNAFKEIKVKFVNEEDYKAFASIIDQKLSLETISIWHPKRDQDQMNRNFVYDSK
jgi:hypothetical protein